MSYSFNENLEFQKKNFILIKKNLNKIYDNNTKRISKLITSSTHDILQSYDRFPSIRFLVSLVEKKEVSDPDILERIKKLVFSSDYSLRFPIQSFGLVPETKYMALEDMAKHLGLLKKSSPDPLRVDSFISLIEKKVDNFILICRDNDCKVEYFISPLIDFRYLFENKFLTLPDSGINYNSIKRFETISLSLGEQNTDSASKNHKIITKITNNKEKIICVEIFGKIFARSLSSNFMMGEIERGFGSRSQQYNKYLNAEIESGLSKLEVGTSAKSEPDMHHMRRILNEAFREYISIIKSSQPKNPSELESILNENLRNISARMIPKNQDPEIFSTYLSKFEEFYIEFKKIILGVKYPKLSPSDDLFVSMAGDPLWQELYHIIQTSADQSIETINGNKPELLQFEPNTLKIKHLLHI
jgi:hypothetical protein